MTIGIGLMYEEGFLLCSDRQMTASMKFGESKMEMFEYPEESDKPFGKAIFALSGNLSLARMIVADCNSALEKLKKEDMTLKNMALTIRHVLLQDFKLHLYSNPSRSPESDPEFLIALWSHVDGLGAFFTEGTAINEMDQFQCIGTGAYLGRYLIAPHILPFLSSHEWAIALACHVLREVKSYDSYCGGKTDIYGLKADGTLAFAHGWTVDDDEKMSKAFLESARFLFNMLAHKETNKYFEESLQEFGKTIRSIRKERIADKKETKQHLKDVLIFGAPKPRMNTPTKTKRSASRKSKGKAAGKS
ncbi:MAG: hypothetical protein JWO20_2779 [Candidatus Angelobacter sp.]|nr:hypothetical protein [Candidatus Angelobacter sp.]